jgi:hypothetical protein
MCPMTVESLPSGKTNLWDYGVQTPISLENPLSRLSISEVFINERKVKLSEPLSVNIQFEDQHYILSQDDLGLLAISGILDNAVNEIKEEFSELWIEYVTCPEEELTEDAKALRAKLIGLVENIE